MPGDLPSGEGTTIATHRNIDPRRGIGRLGEWLAAMALRCRGYRLVARDLRTPQAQVDLLVRKGSTLCVCEVKTRRGPCEPRIRREQARRLLRAASWIQPRFGGPETPIRIDVVTVQLPRRGISWPRIRHYPGAIRVDDYESDFDAW